MPSMQPSTTPPSIWTGQRVRLRAVEPEDWAAFWADSQDTEAARRSHFVPFPMSEVRAQRFAEQAATQWPENDQFRWGIENAQGELVGSISTHGCEPRHGTFSYGIGIFRAFQRQGYASEAILLVLRFFFQELRYQKVHAGVYSFNEPSLRLHENLGFVREGCIRRKIFTGGQFFDEVLFGMTIEEWAARHAQATQRAT